MKKVPSEKLIEQINRAGKNPDRCLYDIDPGHAPRTWKDEQLLNDDNAMTWSR